MFKVLGIYSFDPFATILSTAKYGLVYFLKKISYTWYKSLGSELQSPITKIPFHHDRPQMLNAAATVGLQP